jgi:hypothetical protein
MDLGTAGALMDPDVLTNEMAKAALQPLETISDQTIDFMTKYNVSPQWIFAIVVVIVMGRSFGRIAERVTEHFLTRGKKGD